MLQKVFGHGKQRPVQKQFRLMSLSQAGSTLLSCQACTSQPGKFHLGISHYGPPSWPSCHMATLRQYLGPHRKPGSDRGRACVISPSQLLMAFSWSMHFCEHALRARAPLYSGSFLGIAPTPLVTSTAVFLLSCPGPSKRTLAGGSESVRLHRSGCL